MVDVVTYGGGRRIIVWSVIVFASREKSDRYPPRRRSEKILWFSVQLQVHILLEFLIGQMTSHTVDASLRGQEDVLGSCM